MARHAAEYFSAVEAMLKALANRRRLLMLSMLRAGERHVGGLAEETRLPFKTVSRNLRLMERSGVVLSRRQGIYIYYRLSDGILRFAVDAIETMRGG